ncbi:MAG: beta strand repeat-containing protein [Spirochaetota bacterium]
MNVSLLTATPLTNTRVMLTFNKPVSLSSGQLVSNYRITDSNGNLLNILAASRDPNNSRVVFVDTIPQSGGTTYTVTASNIVGVDGSSLGSSNSATFTAPTNADQTGPQFSSVTALSSTSLEVYFGEAVDKASAETAGNYAVRTGSCSGGTIAVSAAVRDPANFAKVTLTSGALTSGTTYYVCANTNVRDIWGNANAASFSSQAFVYNASTPRVVSALSGSPTSVLVTFDQAMANNAALTTRTNYTFAGCGALATNAGTTVTVVSGTQVLLAPLTTGTAGTCTLSVNTAITSSAGVALTAATQSAIFSYSAATDTTAPAVASVQATNSNTVRVTFTEPINDSTVGTGDFSFSPSLTVTGVTCYTGAGNYTYCDVTTSTDQTTQSYSATVSGIQDVAGNNLPSSTTTFTGDGKPYIVAIYPVDNGTVLVEWSEPVGNAASVGAGDYSITDATSTAATITGAALYPAGTDPSRYVQLTINPTLTSGTSYTLSVNNPTGSVDSTGNGTLGTVPNGGTFTGPSATTAPQVTGGSSPSPTTLIVNFNEPLNNSTIATGDFALSGACNALTINSATQIQAGVVQLVLASGAVADGNCTVTVGAGNVADLAGNTIAATNNTATFSYTGTGTTDSTAPTVASVVASSNTEVRVYFSEPVATASGQNTANYTFSPALTGGVSGIVCSGTVCTITLNAPGTSAVQYGLTISGVQDTATTTANTMASQTVNFSGIGSSVTAPTLYQAVLINSTTVELSFSEQMALTAAQNTAHYTVSGGNTVSAAVLQSDATKVRLTISPGAYGSSNSYTVTGTTGLTDTAGNALGTPASATFSGSATAPAVTNLGDSSDLGVSNSDNITNPSVFPTPGLVFTGTVAANTTVYLYDDGVVVGTAVSDSSGNYTITLTSAGSTVTNGNNVFTVATVGPTGLVSDLSTPLTVNYDATAPGNPATAADLAAGSDTGILTTDNITSDTTPTLSGSGLTAGDYVYIYDGATLIGAALVDGSGNWTWTLTPGDTTMSGAPADQQTYAAAGSSLSDGNHTITYRVGDTAGNTSVNPSPGLVLTIDTTAPTLSTSPLTGNTTLTLTLSENVYNSTGGNLATTDFALAFAANGGTATGASITGITHTAPSGTVVLTLSITGTVSGTETVTVTSVANAVVDAAGNAASVNTGAKTLAAVGVASITGTPTYTAVAPVTGGTTGYIEITWSEGVYTNGSPASGAVVAGDFTVVFTRNGGNSTDAVVSCVTDTASTSCPGTAPAAGATSMRLQITNTGATSGVETIQVSAASNAIYSATSGVTPTTVNTGTLTFPDRLAPTVSSVTSSTADGNFKAGDTISIQVVFSEAVTVTGTPQLTLSTGSPATTAVNFVNVTGGNTLNFTYTVAANNLNADLDYASNAALSAGTSIRDAANNDANRNLANPGAAGSLGANKALNVDAVVPNAPAGIALASADDTGSSNSDGITRNTTNLTFTGTSEANATVRLYYPNTAGTLIGTTTANGSGNWTLDNISLAENTYSIVATAADAAGNVSSASTPAYSLTIDTTAPTTQNAVYGTSSSRTGGGAVTIAGQGPASDQIWFAPSGTTTFTAGATMTQAASGTALTINAPATAGSYKLFVLDLAGNISSESTATLTVDNTAPTISSVAPATNAFVNTANVSYTINEDCVAGSGSRVTWTQTGGTVDPGSPRTANLAGSELTAGTKTNIALTNAPALVSGAIYTVAFTCTDAAGNAATAVSSTNVTFDTTLPVITVTSPTSSSSVTSTAVNYSNSEICQSGSITWTRTGGNADTGGSPAGTHTQALTGAELNAGAFTGSITNNPTLADGAIYSVAFNCTDRAGNVATTVTRTNVTYSPGSLSIASAETLDSDNDGKIDTYRVTFNKPVTDSTFPGHAGHNALGTVTTAWLVAGYTNVRIVTGTLVPGGVDTANDATIYIRFDENVLDCSVATQVGCDTDAKPDLTTTSSPGLQDAAFPNPVIAQVTTGGAAGVVEADSARPILVAARSLGATSLDAIFSEPVDTVEGQTATNYVITGGTAPTVSAATRDGTNTNIVHLTTGTQTGGQAYTLTVNTNVKDLANFNLNSSANSVNFNGVVDPVVSSIVTASATTLTITFNESVKATTAECANQTACALIYQNLSLPVLSAVSTAGSGNNSASYTLTVNPMIEGQAYTTTVLATKIEGVAAPAGRYVSSPNNSATFNGDGRPAANISPDTQTQCPTPTNIPPSAPAATRVVVQYDQTVGATATTVTNYKITGCMTGTDCASGTGAPNSNGASLVTSMGGNKYAVDFTQSFDTDTSQYQLTVTGVQDANGNTIALPGTMSFRCGTDTTPPSLIAASVVAANAGSTVILLTFSESVENVTANVSGNYRYDAQAYGTGVSTAARQTNTAQVQLTFVPALSNGGHQIRVQNVQDLQTNAILDNGVNNVQPVIVNAPTGFTGGPVFTDPFGDGTPAGTIVKYDGKLYLGPDMSSSKLFEVNYGLTTAQTITLDADGTFGAPISAFSGYGTKYTGCNDTFSNPPGGSEQCSTGSTNERDVEGIDTMYAACVGGTSTPTMTGTACTGAAGTERLFMVANNTDVTSNAFYRSFWQTTDKSSSTTTFTLTEGYSGDTGGTAAFRAMNLIVFKDQLFMNFGAELGGGGRGGRVCINPAGCTGASNSTYLSYVGFPNASRLKRLGAGTSLLPNGSANGGAYGDTNLGNQAFNAINVVFEHDNDGAGANESQLYMANGGYSSSALGSARSTNSDGGILRSVLAYSTKTSLPGNCTSGSDGCLTFWEDITPDSLTKWNNYYSIPYPQNTGATGSTNCTTSFVEMDCVLPYNVFVPALKAIPYMRTAPNGDLYMIRNGCSTNSYATNGGANNFRTLRQVCPSGSEVPQLWMMPANCGSAASCAAAWQLVAEYGSTGKTNMASNTGSCGSAPNKCLNNTHITLLEFVGNWLYVGWDNATDGANVWRVDFNSTTCTGSASCMVSGNKPAETQFSIVNLPGIESGGGGTNQKIFSHVTVNDAGKDWLIIITRDGSNAMKIYRTANDQN